MIAEFESRILAFVDDMVEHASDDELLTSGYLRGHLTSKSGKSNRCLRTVVVRSGVSQSDVRQFVRQGKIITP